MMSMVKLNIALPKEMWLDLRRYAETHREPRGRASISESIRMAVERMLTEQKTKAA